MSKKSIFSLLIITIFLVISLMACDIEVNVTVTFDANGGMFENGEETITMTIDAETEEMDYPEDPTREGYIFSGWYQEDEEENPFDEDALANGIIQGDFTLYAIWEEGSAQQNEVITITFDSKGGSAVSPIEFESGETITIPSAPTKEGFDFIGWYLDDETFENQFDIGALPTEDITLYALWEELPQATQGLLFELNTEDDTYELIGYEGTDTDVYVPGVYNGKSVTSLADDVFDDNDIVENLVVGENIVEIGNLACSPLTTLSLPASLTTLREGTII